MRKYTELLLLNFPSYLFYNLLEDIGALANAYVGELQHRLFSGDYQLFKHAPVFESNFIQITKKGHVSNIHHRVTMVTIGITSTDPTLYLPDVLLIAKPSELQMQLQLQMFKRKMMEPLNSSNWVSADNYAPLELLRLFPLKLTKISIYDEKKHRLRLKLATHQSFYLQLIDACPKFEERMFQQWVKLLHRIYT
ncbi:protein FAM71B-like [Callorhinchus milii]|uniref:protein FAM71B-like n=1 Tax=Callorhinchus milii TaxID=7868 RepID=UPI0004575418|nr:protein FAM71B-like [Callorhinchus milii]|eukprot:gi/632987306/ref/XP_007910719.1/ PREDICTED: protein FAM71B-like [Callorhinchus milii]